MLQTQCNDLSRRCEEANLTLSDFDASKKKIIVENADILRNIEELDNNNNVVGKMKATLTAQLQEQKKIAEDESKERTIGGRNSIKGRCTENVIKVCCRCPNVETKV